MQPWQRRGRRGTASATGLLVAVTLFGVLLMHSVAPMTSTSTSADHAAMGSMHAVDSSVPVASGEHDCPSAHQMMHPCVGTTVSWPALTMHATIVEVGRSSNPIDGIGGRTDSTMERAPPWTLWELDRSVTLRV